MPRLCPSCGAELPSLAAICEYCGTSTVPVPLTVAQQEAIFEVVDQANQILEAHAERITHRVNAFTLLFFVIFLVLLTVIRSFIIIDWQYLLASLAAVAAMTLALNIALRSLYQARCFEAAFRSEIQAHFEEFLQKNPMPRWQFENLGRDSLLENAPLRLFLRKDAQSEKV